MEEGLSALAQALDVTHKTGEHFYEAELHRLRGELLLQSYVQGRELETQQEAEGCFL